MKVYVVIKHDWYDRMDVLEEYVDSSIAVFVCSTIERAVIKANEVAKELLDEFKAMDGDEFDGWDYNEEVIERPLTQEELLSTTYHKKICWFYLTNNSGYGLEIKETDLIE
jgi:hypothetical protein